MRMHRVGKTLAALVVAGGLLGTAGYVAVGSPAGNPLFGYGCGDAEERLGEVLAGESVLEVPPDGSRNGESYQECDDDDLFVVAGRSYAYDGSPQSALQHYRDRASAQGWRAVAGDCFTKPVGDTTGYLTVWGPDEGTLQVEITADREDGRWCE